MTTFFDQIRSFFLRIAEYFAGFTAILFIYFLFLFIVDHEQILDLIIRFVFGEPFLE